jgi:hypothetical protein
MKFITITILCTFGLIAGLAIKSNLTAEPRASAPLNNTVRTNSYLIKLRQKSVDAKKYIRQHKMNTEYCFLIDMSILSGKKRFFVYCFQKDSIIHEALVAHGNCFQSWLEGRKYSNSVGSGCTSLGKYRVGNSYTGKFGTSYKLHGLESSNSNAFERTVVLHAYNDVPEQETVDEICQSNGCPMVSPGFFKILQKMISHSKSPILLWIYD